MTSTPAIIIQNLSKKYKLKTEGSLPGGDSEFHALRDLSLEVHKGDVVGIIGSNGSGKSTLLKVLSQITRPSAGEVRFYGSVASILDIGTNFHPDLTGRENVTMHLRLQGVPSGEFARRQAEICSFSEIEAFFDQPVKIYSSGMFLRLAFAVAFHLHADILLLDEVLSVGDEGFRLKCQEMLQRLAAEGRTILFVSHNRNEVLELSTKCLWLDCGAVKKYDRPAFVLGEYFSMHQDNYDRRKLVVDIEGSGSPAHKEQNGNIDLVWEADHAPGNEAFSIRELSVTGAAKGEPIYNTGPVKLRFIIDKKKKGVQVGAFFFLQDVFHQSVMVGHLLNNTENKDLSRGWKDAVGLMEISCEIPAGWLIPGKYYLFPRFGVETGEWTATSEEGIRFSEKLNFTVTPHPSYTDYISDPGKGALRPGLAWQITAIAAV